MTKRRKPLFFGSVLALLSLLPIFAVHYSKPEGMFDDPAIGSLYFAYWEFKDGKVWLVTPDSKSFEGRYYRKDDRWVYQAVSAGNSCLYLESSLLGFRLVDSNHNVALPMRKRIFLRPGVPKEEQNQ